MFIYPSFCMLHCMSTCHMDCSTNSTRCSLVQRVASQCNDLVSFICTYLDALENKVLIAILVKSKCALFKPPQLHI